jgi:pimeloyl-ACP methyl ester carboxylesterase
MRTWVKVVLGLLAGLVVLLVLNAIVMSNQTADAERNAEGAELIETSSGTIQVLDEGNPQGSPIVLIHGYTASLAWFGELTPRLAADHRVISVDLLGHGGSEKPSSGYEISDQANAIAEALAELGVSDATLVGHSLGASVAAAVAEQSPDLAARVVNIDQAPNDGYGELSFTARAGYVPVIGQATKRLTDIAPTSVVRSEFQQAFAPDFNIASGFDDPDQVVEDLNEMTYTAYVDVSNAETEYTDSRALDDRLGALGIPVMVIFGAEDEIYDAEESIEPFRGIDGVQAYVLEGAGHSPQVELPDETAGLINEFIQESPVEAEAPAQKKTPAKKKAAPSKSAGKQGKSSKKEPTKKPGGAAK